MRSVDDLLESAKAATGARNDTELAAKLGIKPAAVSNYRRGVSLPNAVVCATLAGLTGEPLARVLGVVGEARAISSEEKAVWRRLAATATLLAVALLGSAQQPAQAAIQGVQATTAYTLCEVRSGLRWIWHLFTTWARSKRKPRGPHLPARIAA